jgi:hypothetical protein
LGIAMAAGAPSLTENLPSGSQADYRGIEDEIRRGQERFQLPVAQGLISSGHLAAPTDRSWFRGGYIQIRGEQEAQDFEKWWTTRGEDFTDYEDKAKFPYNDVTAAIRHPG